MANPADQPPEAESSLIPINSASQKELQSIHGIGPLLSARIITYREKAGSITNSNQLHIIKGLHARQIEQMAKLIDWSSDQQYEDNLPQSIVPGIIMSAVVSLLTLYLIYPMVQLFLEEFTHWQNNSLHWYTTLVNLFAMVFTCSTLATALTWLLSLFYTSSGTLLRFKSIAIRFSLYSLILLVAISATGYFFFQTQADVAAYMVSLLKVVAGVMVLIYLQFLPQLVYLTKDTLSLRVPLYYDFGLLPFAVVLLFISFVPGNNTLLMDVFLLWIALLVFISSLALVQKRSCFADLLQELTNWPNVMQDPEAGAKMGLFIAQVNADRSSSRFAVYAGGLTLLNSVAVIANCLFMLVTVIFGEWVI
jgi:competence ComEA-like helix-hairpin-helix protein